MTEPVSDILDGKLPFNILTDLPSPAEWHKISRQAGSTIPALDEVFSMIERRMVPDENGVAVPIPEDDITLAQAELLFYLIDKTEPILTLETGFGSGLATCVMTAAHLSNNLSGGHVPIQDNARERLGGVGFHTLDRLKLSGYQVMEHETAMVLPQMYLQGINQGLALAYFNSATAFDEQMMEYFYVSRLLNEGGIMAVNMGHAARRDLVDYVRRARHDYAVRDLSCGVTLIQVPKLSAIVRHNPGLRH